MVGFRCIMSSLVMHARSSHARIPASNRFTASLREVSAVAVEPALMAAALAAARKSLEAGGEPGMIHGIYDLDDKPQDFQVRTSVVINGLNPRRLDKAQHVIDVHPVLRDGLKWASQGFGKGVVVDGKNQRPVCLEDLKVHPNGDYLHVTVHKHGVKAPQEVMFHPKTHYLKHDSTYRALNWDSAMVAAAHWLKANLAEYRQLFDWVGGELNKLKQPFEDGSPKPLEITPEYLAERQAQLGRPVDPQSTRSKAGGRAKAIPTERIVNRPSLDELHPLEVRVAWGGGYTLLAPLQEHLRISKLSTDIHLLLNAAALKLDPTGSVASHILPEVQEMMAAIEARLANLPRPNAVEMAETLTVPDLVQAIAESRSISALRLIPLASKNVLTRYHDDWKRAIKRLHDVKDTLIEELPRVKPGHWLDVDSKSVSIGRNSHTGEIIKEVMPVYHVRADGESRLPAGLATDGDDQQDFSDIDDDLDEEE
jgi:hypothetical protein